MSLIRGLIPNGRGLPWLQFLPPLCSRCPRCEISLCVASLAPARLIRRFPNLLLLWSCLWQSISIEIDCQRQLHRRSRLGNLRINRAGASEATHKDISHRGHREHRGGRNCSHGSPLPFGIKPRIKLIDGRKIERSKI